MKSLNDFCWAGYLNGFNEPVIPHTPRSAYDEAILEKYARVATDLDSHSLEKLKAFCAFNNTHIETVFLAAWSLILNRYCNRDDIVFGVFADGQDTLEPISKHPPEQVIPLRLKLQDLNSLEQLLLDIESYRKELPTLATKHDGRGLAETRELLGTAMQLSNDENSCLTPTNLLSSAQNRFDIGLQVCLEQGVNVSVCYNVDVFDKQSADQLLRHFRNIVINLIASEKSSSLFDVEMLDTDDRAVIESLNQQNSEPYPFIPVHERVRHWAQRSPDSDAIIYGDTRISYAELASRVEKLAQRLRISGVDTESIVILALPQSIDLIVGALAIMQSGGAYLPIDPEESIDRREVMISDAAVTTIITNTEYREHWSEYCNNLLFTDQHTTSTAGDKASDFGACKPDQAAYVIYTSGTTGTPKGVVIEHGSLNNHCITMAKELGVQPGEAALQFASPVFDVSVEEIFTTLCFGGCLVIGNRKLLSSSNQFMSELEAHQVSILNLPTAFWSTLVEAVAKNQAAWPACIKTLAVGGEKVSTDTYREFCNQETGHIRFLNGYGPTEATITSTVYPAPACSQLTQNAEKLSEPTLPIGRPIQNVLHYVLDNHKRLCPRGVKGQLYVGGPGVARGYLDRDELTASRFVRLPEIDQNAGKFYATGDIVLCDGEDLFCYGRTDHQVKVRGYRVELGEIEAALARHNDVRGSCVDLCTEKNNDLVAFVETSLSQQQAVDILKPYLLSLLPDYMVPSKFFCRPKFSLTQAGKVDRNALWKDYYKEARALDISDPEEEHTADAPISAIQKKLAGICGGLLGGMPLALHDSFFEKGGHSLLAVKLFSIIESEFNILIPVREFFSDPTISTLEKLIEEADQIPVAAPETANDIGNLHQLQPNGNGCPLYFICGVDLYQELATTLGETQPVYGIFVPVEEKLLKAFSEHADAYVLPAMSEIAADYVTVIRENQPFGPYKLAGLSFGGLLAFEIAQQLKAAGEAVEDLILIDTFVPKNPAKLSQIDLKAQWTQLRALRAKYFRGCVRKVSRLLTANRSANKLKKMVTGTERQAKDMDFPLFRALVYGRGAREYSTQIQPYSGDVILIHAADGDGEVNGVNTEYHGWEEIVSGSLKRYEVGGDHVGVLKQPNATQLADSILPHLKSSNYQSPELFTESIR